MRFSIKDNIAWYDIWRGHEFNRLYSPMVLHNFHEDFVRDLSEANLTVEKLKQYFIIVNTNWEGHNAKDIEPFRAMLIDIGFPINQFGVLFTCFEDTDKLPYPSACVTERLIYNASWHTILKQQNIQWYNLEMNHKFVVLMRRASESRCSLAKKLLDSFSMQDLCITLGTFPDSIPLEWQQLVSPYNYPMVVDSPIVNREQHNPQHNLFYTAPVQLVVETSHETDRDAWRNIFITEKSYKVFAWHQFPLWYAVPGTVSKLRDAGFDLFDDLINHNYDNEENPDIRMNKVVAELQKFCRHDTAKFFRIYYFDRLEYNAQLVEKIIKTAYRTHKTKVQSLQDELFQLYK